MGLIIGVLTGVGAVLIAVAIASSLGMTALEWLCLGLELAPWRRSALLTSYQKKADSEGIDSTGDRS
jgi:hypothetical protein